MKPELNHAILDEAGNVLPVQVYDKDHHLIEAKLFKWARWFEANEAKRRIALDQLGDHLVSTVFLGLNHAYLSGMTPLWFETMVFGPRGEAVELWNGKLWNPRPDLWSKRTSTKTLALAAHQEGLAYLKTLLE